MKPVPSWSLDATAQTFRENDFGVEYLGLELQKRREDLERYRVVVEETRPDLLIETGTRYGASAEWFHRELGLQVVTVDVEPKVQRGFNRAGVKSVKGSSISDWVFEGLLKDCRGKRVMVSLDSDHHSPHVQAELGRLGALVSKGCYLVVEDACFDLFGRAGDFALANRGGGRIALVGGPLDALEKSRIEHHSGWTRDTEVEGLFEVSHSPCGWWRRRD